MVVGAREAGVNVSETAGLLGFSCISTLYTEFYGKAKQHFVSGSSMGRNALFMREVKGEWREWLNQTARLC